MPLGRVMMLTIFMIALGLRLALLVATGPISAPDTAEYRLLAHNVLTTGEYARKDVPTGQWQPYAFRMPLYQYVLAGIFAAFGEGRAGEWAIVIFQDVLSAATACLVGAIGTLTVGTAAGALAAVLFAIDPLSILYSTYILTDTLFAFLTAAALWAGVRALRHRSGPCFLIWGLLIGAAVLARPLFKYYLVVPIGTLILLRWPIRATFRSLVAFVLGFTLLVGPWMIRNRTQLGFWGLELNQGLNAVWSTFRITEKSSPGEQAADPNLAAVRDLVARSTEPGTIYDDVRRELRVSEVAADHYLERIGLETFRRHPLEVAAIAGGNAVQIMISRVGTHEILQRASATDDASRTAKMKSAIPMFLLLLSFFVSLSAIWASCYLATNRENWPWLTCFILTCLYVVGLTSLVAGSNRYRLPVEGILLLLSATFVVDLLRRLARRIPSGIRQWRREV